MTNKTRFFYDTEFLEDGRTIDLISIGIVCEDGREYYAINTGAPWKRINQHAWLRENVLPSLPQIRGDRRHYVSARRNPAAIDFYHPSFKPTSIIAAEVRDFLLSGRNLPELWAWYGAYDHVALCQLWGSMVDLPEGVPMWTNDLRQESERLGNPEMPTQAVGVHNALEDARHNLAMWKFLRRLPATTGEDQNDD